MGNDCSKGLSFGVNDRKKRPQKSKRERRKKRPQRQRESEIESSTIDETQENDISIKPKPRTLADIELIDNNSKEIFEVNDPEAFNELFIQQRQKAINNTSYRSTIESWQPNSLQQLTRLIKDLSVGKSIIDRHWIIFYWITYNIEYDTVSYFSKNYKDQTAEGVFQNRKGVCAGYANIYQYICDQLEMPCEVVGGYSKGYGFEDRADAPTETDHAWNAVRIYNHWYLMESTWGAGHLDDKKEFQRKLSTYYFLPRPNEMIYHHLPEDEKWQLLKTPIKMSQYLELAKLRPDYFEFKLEMIQPHYKCFIDFEQDKPYALVIIKTPLEISILADLKLQDKVIEYCSQVTFHKKNRSYYCYFAPPDLGNYKAMIYVKHGSTETSTHRCVLDFKFNVKRMPENPISYPELWQSFHDHRIKILSPLNTHLVNVTDNTKYGEIILRTPSDIELLGKLTDQNEKEIMCGQQVYYDRDKRFWRCRFAPNRNGLFTALILAKKKSDLGVYKSLVQFQIKANEISSPFVSFPKTWANFYDLGLEILWPIDKGIFVLNEKTSYARIRIKAPNDVDLMIQLNNDRNETIPNAAEIHYDETKQYWSGKFIGNQIGLFDGTILAKKKSDSGHYSSAVSFKLDVKKSSSKSAYILNTSQLFYNLRIEVLPPYNNHKIVLSEKVNFVEILLKVPQDVELVGKLQNSDGENLPYSHQVYYDRHEDVWRCQFAPNDKGIFNAIVMAKKKSDSGAYKEVVNFPIEVNHIPKSSLTFPSTWQLFYDYDLEIKSPRSRAAPKWLNKSSYVEVLIRAPDNIQLSCNLTYNNTTVENGSLTQYDHKQQLWQFLFAPERTGSHQLIVYAKRITDKDKLPSSVVMFPLTVTNLRERIKFPSTYTHFEATKCQIYSPLNGILEKDSIVNIHCCIPGAESIMVTAGPKTLRGAGYIDPIFQREITVGSEEIIIHAKYGHNPHYTSLIKYSVE